MYENRSEYYHETYATLFNIIGTCMMKNVRPLECIVVSLFNLVSSRAVLPAIQI